MKKVKKVFGLVTAAALFAAVVGCGSSNNSDSSNSPSASGSAPASASASAPAEKLKKITIFQSKVEIADSLEAAAKKYTEETGNEVEVWGAAGDAYMTQLQAKLTSNQGPSLFSVGAGPEADKFKSYLADMSNEPYAANIAPNMELKEDGKTVGVPYGVEGFGMVYNKKLVDQANMKDADSFIKTLQDLKGKGVNPFSLSQEAYFLIGHIINAPFAAQPDPQAFIEKLNKGEVKMADTKEFQEWAKMMEAIKATSKNPMEVKYDTQMGDFGTGKTAIVNQGNWSYGMLKDFGDMSNDVGMAPFPLGGNDKLAVGVASYWVINSKADADEQKAASAFLNWLLTSETGKNTIVNEWKFIPAMTNIEAADLDPLSKDVFEATKSGQTVPWAFIYFPQGIIVNDLAPAAQEFFLKKDMTGAQFLQKLDAAWAKAAK
ncbi:ABC transporter substrate-binding protein [Cohnella pontilimi]|uniref:ABC transporter substrate-binding protein n=1 Tax=Cohnella pontilimi TaxID=2564100 RepID=A0A4U0FDR4_9BACL|nr:ABC transporter substrate-binding protein [Cohnella pontilimi]TJY42888.1 ABC transporter substrate-binding protein [Cohnella pontilimi]